MNSHSQQSSARDENAFGKSMSVTMDHASLDHQPVVNLQQSYTNQQRKKFMQGPSTVKNSHDKTLTSGTFCELENLPEV